ACIIIEGEGKGIFGMDGSNIVGILTHIRLGVQDVAVDGFEPSLYGIGIVHALYPQVAEAHPGQRAMLVIIVFRIPFPEEAVGTGFYFGDAVIGIIFITLV